MSVQHRLVTYGTLVPGPINHHQISALAGEWKTGTVRGRLIKEGWGAEHGCPGIILDDRGELVEVSIFESADLPDHWERLDAFEGAEYQRVVVRVETDEGTLDAFIYELADAIHSSS